MTSSHPFDPDEVIIDGLTNFVEITQDNSDAERGAYLYRSVAEVFRQNLKPGDVCPIALPSMIIRPDLRKECFVAVTSSHLIVAWQKGMIRKTTESEVIPISSITDAKSEVSASSPTRGATLMHVHGAHSVTFALPKGRADLAEVIRTALLADSAAPADGRAAPILDVRNVEVVYGGAIRSLQGVSLTVQQGAIVALLGANGAGKTTLLRAIAGLLPVHDGHIRRGEIDLYGESILGLDTPAIVRRGVAQVMEGRRIFAELTVDENLRSGAFTRRDRQAAKETYDQVMEMFPVIAERRRSTAGYLSGGEQQMVAIARALMAGPRLLLLDEPSLGLAPLIVEQIRGTIATIAEGGMSVLLVEQNAVMALSIAAHGYVLENGNIVRDAPAAELLGDEEIREAYLGIGERGHRSFKELKTYRRRRSWSV